MSVQIAPSATVYAQAQLGDGVEIGPNCVVGPKVVLGDRVKLWCGVVVCGRTTIGADTMVYDHAVLGRPPQDFKYQDEDTTLDIGERNVIREHVTMHVGTGVGRGATTVGDDGYFMVGAHIGHDCVVGDRATFANMATLGGHCHVGDQVIMGGLSAIHQHCRLGRHAFLGGGAIVTGDVIPYGMVDNRGWLAGLNLVGLKRRGFSRDVIQDMRNAYRLFFAAEGAFQERVDDVADLFAQSTEVGEMVQFIREQNHRPLCVPEAR